MTLDLAERAGLIEPSATLAMGAEAKRLKSQGLEILDFALGEPDFDTPVNIQEAALRAIRAGKTHYTPPAGIAELRQAVADHYTRQEGLPTEMNQVVVSNGAKHSIHNALMAVCGPGDEVIIPAPYWVSYSDLVKLTGAKPVVLATTESSGFKLTPQQFLDAVTPRSRLLMINSPSNPTGMAYDADELRDHGEVLRKHPELMIATDDMYEHIVWKPGRFVNILNVCPDLYDRTIVLNGVSKAYSMTGWRIGYAAGPAGLIEAMASIQSQSTSNPTSISQIAAEAALNGDQSCIGEMVNAFKERQDYVVRALNAIPGIECLATDGTFYVLPNVQGAIERVPGVSDDLGLAEYLIERGVAVVPGSAFGAAGHLRLSIATSLANLEKALERIEQALA